MKNFVKVLAILLAIFMALAVFAACGKKNDDKPDDKPADTTPVDDKPADDTPKHEHAWGEGKVTKEATCTEEGEKTFTCSGCNETKTEKIAALGHTWDEGKVTKEATVDEEGEKTFTCTVCGETKTEKIEKVPAPSVEDPDTKYYELQDDGTYIFYEYYGEETDVTVKAILNGRKVVAIGERAFSTKPEAITSVTIEDGIKTIGEAAFEGCTGLTGIIIPDSVTEIGENAFKDCTGLQMVKLSAGMKAVPASAFDGCSKIAILDLGGVESLAAGSFDSAKVSLVSVTLGEKMVELNGCFEDAVKDYKLVSIVNNSKDEDFAPTGKVAELIQKIADVKEDKGVEIHVEILNNYVFYLDENENASLVSYIGATQEEDEDKQDNAKKVLVLPESYGKDDNYTIYKYAFYNRTDIAKVEISEGVTEIGANAFEGCTGLTAIKYPGKKTAWVAFKKGADWDKTTGAYTVACTNGDLCKTHDFEDAEKVPFTNTATCTEKGQAYYYCTTCKTYFTEDKKVTDANATTVATDTQFEHAALGHDYVHHDEKSATALEAGTKEHYTCTRCTTVFDKDKNVVDPSSLEIPYVPDP